MVWRIRIKFKHLNEKNITVLGCSDFEVKAVQKKQIDNGTFLKKCYRSLLIHLFKYLLLF